MDSKYEHRKVTHDDLGTIAELWLASALFHEEIDPRFQYASNARESIKDYFSNQIQKDTFIMYIASTENEDVGFIEAQVMEKSPIHLQRRIGYVGSLFVRSQNRQNGVGFRLWELVYDWFSKQKINKIQLAVAARNSDGIAFWHKLGFAELMMQMEYKSI